MYDYISNYPVRVTTPIHGKVKMLLWYTHDDGHHLIVADSLDKVAAMYDSTLGKRDYRDAKPVEYWEGWTVQLPKEHQLALSKVKYNNASWNFKNWLAASIRSLRIKPVAFQRCTKRVKEKHYDGKPDHSGCKFCAAGWVHTSLSYAEIFEKIGPKGKDLDRLRVYSPRGPVAITEAPVYGIGMDFGHHCKGIGIGELDLNSDSPAAFYFQGKKLPIPTAIETVQETSADRKVKSEKLADQRQKEWQKRYEDEEEKKILDVLKPIL